jgi:DNA repair protein RecN (Recombination protein N)
MLDYLRITNVALIQDVELELAPGLNVLTGETGAGKSFILRALDFLLGERLEPGLVRPNEQNAAVEALFVLDGEELSLRRELSAETGRSRVFVSGRLASQEALRELRPRLVLHTSQHAQQRLLSPAYQAQLADARLADPGLPAARDAALAAWRQASAARAALADTLKDLTARRELLEFQAKEIATVDPRPGEEEELSSRREELSTAAKAAAGVDRALALLHGSGEGLLALTDRLSSEMAALAKAVPGFAPEAADLAEARLRLRELDARLRKGAGVADAARELEAVEARLFAMSKLKRKLGRSMEEIVSLRQEIAANLSLLDSCGLEQRRLASAEAAALEGLRLSAAALDADRATAAASLARDLSADLRGLGFAESARAEFAFEPAPLAPGVDEQRARLLWLPNPGLPPQPLDRIASGGELSRFLLALAGLLSSQDLPTLLFDEVDAGVGGLTLNRVGERLSALAARQQVLLVTHWPQLAALAQRHFHVHKDQDADQTTVRCRRLAPDELSEELARMAGGGPRGQALARELMVERTQAGEAARALP